MLRRNFLSLAAQGAAGALLGCLDSTTTGTPPGASRLSFQSGPPTGTVALGLQNIGLDIFRDGKLYVPDSYTPAEPLPLIVLLHGAGGSGEAWFGSYGPRADAARVILLAPDSRFLTWDAITNSVGAFGPDVDFISRALTSVFSRCAINASRMALFGFSDGASYALSLGLANGDYFRHIAAFSPGYLIDAPRHGTPDFFISHGLNDGILPIDRSSRVIVPELRAAGFDVQYTEFDGEHEVPQEISTAAFNWLLPRF